MEKVTIKSCAKTVEANIDSTVDYIQPFSCGQEEGKAPEMLFRDLYSPNKIDSIDKDDDKDIRYKEDSDITIKDAETTEIISFKSKDFIKCNEKVSTAKLSNDDKEYNCKDVSDINLEDADNSEIVNFKPKGFITHSEGDSKSYHEPNTDSDVKIEDKDCGSVSNEYKALMKNNQETLEDETKDSDLSLEEVCDISVVTMSEKNTIN